MREDFDSSMEPPDDPIIVCLCGSGKFKDAFDQSEFDETVAGKIVLTIGCNTKDVARDGSLDHLKPMLDELHKRKIDLADEILVLNVGGNIGDSTKSEIAYAQKLNKTIRYLESEPTPIPLIEAVKRLTHLLEGWQYATVAGAKQIDEAVEVTLQSLAREKRIAEKRDDLIEEIEICHIDRLKATTHICPICTAHRELRREQEAAK